MSLLPYLREKNIRPKVRKEQEFYNNMEVGKITNYQINVFNQIWETIQTHVPYYNDLVNKRKVPKIITNFEEFKKLPTIDRSFANQHIKELIDRSKKPDSWGTTGGSTGNPLQYPSWKTETQECEPAVWYVRDFYNIKRSDRMFRIWGHSHTLGSGLTKYKNMLKFKIGLPLIGYKRFSAYDLSNEKLRDAGEQIINFKPKYIVGYSKALYMLAKVNADRKTEFHKLNLKVVMGAAEGFDKNEDKNFISEIFGCPVGLQYATMETKYLAHTHPDGGYKVLWRNNLIECVDNEGNPSQSGRILVTSLYPRAFPLIRYEIGDIITGTEKNLESVYRFEAVKGRDNDFLMLDENTPIHSEGITHAIKFSKKVTAYQIRYTKDLKYTIYLKSDVEITENDIREIKHRLLKIDKRLAELEIKRVNELRQTIAGKTKWLTRE
ncbi:hypothetical protein SPD48_12975 [Pseudogracilibacillus sp. SE30717A]|uniref:hypothetical protein n=1 Tax=Pseudogracilibacillus sp. SE30717A TaxID=3098293 RepID=UPI00300E0AC5